MNLLTCFLLVFGSSTIYADKVPTNLCPCGTFSGFCNIAGHCKNTSHFCIGGVNCCDTKCENPSGPCGPNGQCLPGEECLGDCCCPIPTNPCPCGNFAGPCSIRCTESGGICVGELCCIGASCPDTSGPCEGTANVCPAGESCIDGCCCANPCPCGTYVQPCDNGQCDKGQLCIDGDCCRAITCANPSGPCDTNFKCLPGETCIGDCCCPISLPNPCPCGQYRGPCNNGTCQGVNEVCVNGSCCVPQATCPVPNYDPVYCSVVKVYRICEIDEDCDINQICCEGDCGGSFCKEVVECQYPTGPCLPHGQCPPYQDCIYDCCCSQCPTDVKICPNGPIVMRLPPSCKFPQCPTPWFECLCHFLDHLRRDFSRFLELHKDLIASIGFNKRKRCQEALNQIWDDIKCINELICNVTEIKEKIENNQIDIYGTKMADILWNWIVLITEKASNIVNAVNKLDKRWFKLEQRELVMNLSILRSSCLMNATAKPLELGHSTGHMIMEADLSGAGINPNGTLSDICKKAEQLGLMYHKIGWYDIIVWHDVFGVFTIHGRLDLVPSSWFWNKYKCARAIKSLYYRLRHCCRYEKKYTLPELVKKLGDWLSDAMKVRELFRDCFPKTSTGVPVYQAILEIGESAAGDAEIQLQSINSKYEDFLKDFDACIIELRCMYIEWLMIFWL